MSEYVYSSANYVPKGGERGKVTILSSRPWWKPIPLFKNEAMKKKETHFQLYGESDISCDKDHFNHAKKFLKFFYYTFFKILIWHPEEGGMGTNWGGRGRNPGTSTTLPRPI